MPLQNRVQPTGEIIADPARGLLTGNRGIIHRADGTLGTPRWSHQHWLICTLTHPRGTYHGPMPDRGWSALFFLDEAVAIAAGHRPCHYCRRAAYVAWQTAWAEATGAAPNRLAMDRALHHSRVTRQRMQVRFEHPLRNVPTGAFVLWDERAHLRIGNLLLPYSPEGYGDPIKLVDAQVTVLTPAPSCAVLAAGYEPILHPSARFTEL